MFQASDRVEVCVEGAGPDECVPGRIQCPRAAQPHQDIWRTRVGATNVRNPEHRRQGLEAEHAIQGRLPSEPHCYPVAVEGKATRIILQ